MTRVVHLVTSLDVGGAQRMLLRLLQHSESRAFVQRVVSLVPGGALRPDFERTGVEVEDLGLRPGRLDLRGWSRLMRSLKRSPADVLQTWLYHADLLGALVARRHRVGALAWNLRNAGQSDGRRSRLRGAVVRACAGLSRRPDVVVVNSEAGRRFHEAQGYRPRRWEVIPNGFEAAPLVGPDERLAARSALGVDPDAVVHLTLARWHPTKGLDVLFAALERTHERALALVAGDGVEADRPEVRAALPQAAAARVRLLGLRRDVRRLLAAADFLVLPSRFEGFPNALGEALAAGLPCVTTDVGDARAIVGEAGRVVPPDDPAALAGGIDELARLTPPERAALGTAGRSALEARFSLSAVVKRYRDLYLGL